MLASDGTATGGRSPTTTSTAAGGLKRCAARCRRPGRSGRRGFTRSKAAGLRDRQQMPTLTAFVDRWREEVAGALAASTRRGYETVLRHHLLPAFGTIPLDAISKATVQKFIAEKSTQQRFDYTRGRHPKPDRATLSGKTIRNMVAVLSAILQVRGGGLRTPGPQPAGGGAAHPPPATLPDAQVADHAEGARPRTGRVQAR